MVLQGDCIEEMKKLEADSVDTLITDPPYAISMDKWDTWKDLFDFQEWMYEVAKEAFRVIRPGGSVAVFAAARTYHHTAIAFERAGFVCRDMVEWVYWSGLPKGKNLKQCHEPIYLGWKPEKNLQNYVFNIDSVRIPVKNKKKKGVDVIEINGKVEIPVEVVDKKDLLEF